MPQSNDTYSLAKQTILIGRISSLLILVFWWDLFQRKPKMEYPLMRWKDYQSSASMALKRRLTLAKKSLHLSRKGLQVLFRGTLANFLRLSRACWNNKRWSRWGEKSLSAHQYVIQLLFCSYKLLCVQSAPAEPALKNLSWISAE